MFIAIKTRFCLPCCRRKNDQNHEFEYFAFYEPGKKHCMSKIPVISCVLRILDGNQAGSNIERERVVWAIIKYKVNQWNCSCSSKSPILTEIF